jgi:hypothetical protein
MPKGQPLHLPARPILDRIEWKGGLAAILPGGEQDPDYGRIRKALNRAKDSGAMTVYLADELAIKLLKTHPSFIYPIWFDLNSENSRALCPCELCTPDQQTVAA